MSHLVLTRKLGEKVMVGENVTVTVLDIRSGQVKLGIEAPPELPVHRFEIWNRIRLGFERSKRAAAAAREQRERSA